MSSLRSVVNIVYNVTHVDLASFAFGPKDAKRSRQEIQDYLSTCPSSQNLRQWHQEMELGSQEVNCKVLGELRLRVAHCLIQAAQDVETLRLLEPKPEDPRHDKHLLTQALNHTLHAFQEFATVCKTPELNARDTMEVILDYLKHVFDMTIPLASAAGPPGTEDFIVCWREFATVTGLRGIRFDDDEEPKPKRVVDRVRLAGVIAPADALPPCFLPEHPGPPLVYHSPSPFGPAIPHNTFASSDQTSSMDVLVPVNGEDEGWETSSMDILAPVNGKDEEWMMEELWNPGYGIAENYHRGNQDTHWNDRITDVEVVAQI